jgi:hypothetical protein
MARKKQNPDNTPGVLKLIQQIFIAGGTVFIVSTIIGLFMCPPLAATQTGINIGMCWRIEQEILNSLFSLGTKNPTVMGLLGAAVPIIKAGFRRLSKHFRASELTLVEDKKEGKN